MEIIKDKICRDTLKETVNDIADVVTTTMGPGGGTVVIVDENGNPYITKDGVSVAKKIWFNDASKNMIAQLFKQVAEQTVEKAGDGTTTSICLARELINFGWNLIENDECPYLELKEQLEQLEKDVLSKLKEKTIRLQKRNIKHVATIAANNDNSIGDIIQLAYDHSNIVKVEEGNKQEDELITINGMKVEAPMFDRSFINTPESQSIEYTDVPILIFEGHLNKIDDYVNVIEQHPDGIIIMADYFSDDLVALLKHHYNRGKIKIGLIKSPGFAQHRKDLVSDIATFVDGEVLNPNKKYTSYKIGLVDSIKIGYDNTIFYKENLTDSPTKLANYLKQSLNDMDGQQKYLTKKRIENLTGKISIIKVGGNSEVEMKERKDRIDDAVLAVSCGLEEGIIEGGGKTLYNLSNEIDNYFNTCLLAPYNTINKRYKLELNKDFIEEGIIDPTKVTRIALQNAISVAKTILSTEAIVLHRLWIH